MPRVYFSLIYFIVQQKLGFPAGSVVKNPSATQETQVPLLGWEDILEGEMPT